MSKQVIEIANDGIFLSIKRGFCRVSDSNGKVSDVPLDEILSIVVSSNNVVISKNIINAITNNNGVIIFCGKNYMPTSIILPYANHWQNGERVRKQIEAYLPLQKSLWKTLIEKKINNQALILEWFNPNSQKINRLRQLAKSVKSGDINNNEAIAAQIYFKELFGAEFIRDRSASNINMLLNYTYIVLRACVARAVAGVGLLPALGIIHTNKLNPFTLVDDLVEPYRPLADLIVCETLSNVEDEKNIILTPYIKRRLVGITSLNLENKRGVRSLPTSLFETANSLAKSYIEKKNLLEIDKYVVTPNELIK